MSPTRQPHRTPEPCLTARGLGCRRAACPCRHPRILTPLPIDAAGDDCHLPVLTVQSGLGQVRLPLVAFSAVWFGLVRTDGMTGSRLPRLERGRLLAGATAWSRLVAEVTRLALRRCTISLIWRRSASASNAPTAPPGPRRSGSCRSATTSRVGDHIYVRSACGSNGGWYLRLRANPDGEVRNSEHRYRYGVRAEPTTDVAPATP